jgi:hypothetical protein
MAREWRWKKYEQWSLYCLLFLSIVTLALNWLSKQAPFIELALLSWIDCSVVLQRLSNGF